MANKYKVLPGAVYLLLKFASKVRLRILIRTSFILDMGNLFRQALTFICNLQPDLYLSLC
jgi:hypothetical protein